MKDNTTILTTKKNKQTLNIKPIRINFANNLKLLADCTETEIGTKAKNIKIIKEQGGCLIPKTLVINTKIFNQLLADNKILKPHSYNWSLFKIPNKYQKQIIKKISEEFHNKPLVIRSSATCEDSPLLSFAGQYSSFLNITGEKNIIKAINLCYQSLFSDNAKIYAKINKVKLENEKMAIAIQELAPVKLAGVIFTTNPVNQDKKTIIVEYTKGLGDSIVSGQKKPIVEEIKKTDVKNLKNVFLKKLAEEALILEKVFGAPQDIEWGWSGKDLYIFQSRNITTLNQKPITLNYTLNKNKIIGTGIVACRGISVGFLKIINSKEDYKKIKKGDVVLMKSKLDISLIKNIPFIGALIISGGTLSHLAVIAREFNVPCLLELKVTTKPIDDYENKKIIVDAITGKILLS